MCSIHGLNILQGPSQILRVLTQVAIRYSIALWLPHTHTLTHHTHIHANTQIHHTHIQKYIYTHKSTHIYTHKYTTTHIHIPHMPQTWGPLRTEHDGHRGCQPRSGGDPGNKATSEVEHGPGEWPENDRAQSRNPRCRSALVVQ